MSNINKQALREAAQEEIMLRSVSDTSDAWQDEASPEAVLALLDDLEAANVLNKHLELAIRKAEGCSEALRRKAEAAEKRIAELEARELVVNLPAYVDGRTLGYGEVNHMIDLCVDAFERACHSAGINLTVEG